jgi:hypothetical protein
MAIQVSDAELKTSLSIRLLGDEEVTAVCGGLFIADPVQYILRPHPLPESMTPVQPKARPVPMDEIYPG